MKIERIELHHVDLPLAHPFETSFGRERTRPCILVAVHADGLNGWGECTAGSGPWYSSETIETAWHLLRDFLIPAVLGQQITSPADVVSRFRRVRGHPMARAGLENAVWDLLAQAQGVSLANLLGGQRERVAVGVSVGAPAVWVEKISAATMVVVASISAGDGPQAERQNPKIDTAIKM